MQPKLLFQQNMRARLLQIQLLLAFLQSLTSGTSSSVLIQQRLFIASVVEKTRLVNLNPQEICSETLLFRFSIQILDSPKTKQYIYIDFRL